MRKALVLVSALAFGIAGSSACASKGFVKNQVGQVSGKVDSLSQSLEETQQRTKENEAKINDVDQKTQAAQASANTAQQAASAADQKAVAANTAATTVNGRVDDLDKSTKRLMYTIVLNDAEGNFKFNSTTLPDEAKSKIDDMVKGIIADPKGAYFEIEGHTDNVGPADVNERIGMERADAVKRYLYEQYQIPLHRMNVISYGAEKPVAPNTTRDGRAQNRRVVIKVLN
jgi:outer membrane protein OmpA-like peptidoglycan-associated protein